MEKYCFEENVWETPIKCVGKKKVIKYKCLICQYEHEYDETWTDAKKAEVQAEMDAHHAEHLNFEKV
jgi:hypothetical protein